MTHRKQQLRGQVLVMVTFALFAMVGLVGLAVDFGWAFFVEKSAQAAADAAALAAVKMVIDTAATPADYLCTGSVAQCYAAPTPCPTSGSLPRNLQGACMYAAQNGFNRTNPRQNVTVQASDRLTAPTVSGCTPTVNHPPTAPCVDVEYWVTVRTSETVPQLFSAIFNNANALVSARATAAIAQSEVKGALILLNRQNEAWRDDTGTNLELDGTPEVVAPGGIILASNSSIPNDEAGVIDGAGSVKPCNGTTNLPPNCTPFTYVRTGGTVNPGSSPDPWPYINQPDGSMFEDPMRGKGQPPLHPDLHNPLRMIPVPGGVLTGLQCPGNVCPPGNYFATTIRNVSGVNTTFASGQRIIIPNNTTFSFAGGGFGDYVFFGGLLVDRATVNFGPGRYVMAGSLTGSTPVFESTNNAWITGGTSETSDAGRVFILTDSSYDGRLDQTVANIPVTRDWTQLAFGRSIFKAGANQQSLFRVYGLNTLDSNLPPELKTFGPVVIWQDQKNSNVDYTSSGNIDLNCKGATIDAPCTNPFSNSRELELHANQRSTFGGIVYQPRGAWTWIQAAPGYTGPLRIITGAMELQGNGGLTLTSPTVPLTRLTAALVE